MTTTGAGYIAITDSHIQNEVPDYQTCFIFLYFLFAMFNFIGVFALFSILTFYCCK